MKFISYSYFFFILLLVSCKHGDNNLRSYIQETFPNLKRGEVLVIPNSGCSGCISDAENSVDSLIKMSNLKVIFTRIQSIKALKYRLSTKKIDISNPNIILDTTNLYIKNSAEFSALWPFPTKIVVENYSVTNVYKQ